MKTVIKHGVILEKTENDFENLGVFNPAAIQDGNTVHMFYRAVREGNFSSLGYCKFDGPLKIVERSDEPVFYPKERYEFQGTEDPRITKIDNTYFLSYVAFDGINVFGAYATSKDLQKFERKGIITPKLTYDEFSELTKISVDKLSAEHFRFYSLFIRYNLDKLIKDKIFVWDKDVVFFPKKIKGKFAFLHRIHPSIQIAYFNDPAELTKEFWQEYVIDLHKHIVLLPQCHHELSHIGAGCPPIETEFGWLIIYHSAEYTSKGFIYHACAALFDLEDPTHLIARLKRPLFSPTEVWEKQGYVNNVVFPTGTALFGEDLYIYYGAADLRIAVASVNINELLQELRS